MKQVGDGVDDQHHHEGHRAFQEIRDVPAHQCEDQESSSDPAGDQCDDHGLQKAQQDAGQRLLDRAGDNEFKYQHGKQRADRIDDDTLPLKRRLHARHRPDVTEQRNDDGWSRHDQDRAQQHRDFPWEIQDPPRGQCDQQPGNRDAEEDDCHRDGHEGEEHVSKEFVRAKKSRNGSRRESDKEKQQDCGQVKAPGEPLRSDAQRHDGRNAYQEFFGHATFGFSSSNSFPSQNLRVDMLDS